MAEGMLSVEEFERNIFEFLQVSERLKDGWELKHEKNQTQESCPFLVKRNALRALHFTGIPNTGCLQEPSGTEEAGIDETTRNMEEEDDVEDVVRNGCDMGTPMVVTVCQFDYHIVYHPSYSVPTLYFSACHEDGRLLSLDEVWQSVPAHYQKRLQSERWTFITQQEHPVLCRPFYSLHPCHTADLMKAVFKTSKYRNYVVTWLSSVGPVVGLSLPLQYAKLCEGT